MSATLREQMPSMPEPAQAPIIVVGTGPVGIRVAQEILARKPQQPLLLFGDEPWLPYDRVRLSALLAGDLHWDELQNPLRTDLASNVVQHHNCAVASIDRARRQVLDRDGRVHRFSQMILAVGSRPHIPSIRGISQSGVYRFRDMSDMHALAARKASSRHCIVLGGGLLGLEAAWGLCGAGTRVTVIEHAAHIMSGQLDAEAAALLTERMQARGIHLLTGQAVQKVVGDGRVRAVRLRDCELPCDTLVIAAGIRPNVELARECGLRVNRGIVVDDRCQTSDPAIFAIGECAEHRGRVYGLVAPGYEQAAVVAHRLTGGAPLYTGSAQMARLKIVRQTVVSVGEVAETSAADAPRHWYFRDAQAGIYRRLSVRRGRLIGAIAVGDWSDIGRLQEAVGRQRRVRYWQLLRFRRRGSLWGDAAAQGVRDWPGDATVCNCMGVTRATLGAALAAGANTPERLQARTGASSICGSCRPLLAELTGAAGVAVDQRGRNLLMGSAMAAVLALLLLTTIPAAIVGADSFGDPLYRLGALWRDGGWKQVSGFSALGLLVGGLTLSARKRVDRLDYGAYGVWRAAHAALGAGVILLLLFHTGLQAGERLNAWLLIDFVLLSLAGVLSAVALTAADLPTRRQRRWQNLLARAHLFLSWPLPALLGFHILSVYYF